MSHDHHHNHTHGTSRDLLIAFGLNAVFTVFEIIGGLYINSVAVLSDALHDLGDSISLGLAWALGKKAEQGSDQKYSYGYLRFSLLGALINTIVLIVGSLLVLRQAIPRLLNPEAFDATGMVIFALVGIAANGAAVLRLRGQRSANARVVGWHLLEDVLGWAAVLVVGAVSLVVDWPVLDPLLSIGITLYVLVNVIRRLRDTLNLFLQAVPSDIDLANVEGQLRAVDGVQAVHHTHLWSLDGEHHVFSTHLVVGEDTGKDSALCIKQDCRRALSGLDLAHVTIEIEYGAHDCSMNAG